MSNINLPSDSNTVSLPSGVRSDPGGHGTTRITTVDGVKTEEHITQLQYRPSQVSNGLNGILATGIGFGGRRIRSEADIKDVTRFTINGIECDALSAARMGFLTKNGDNSYSLPAKGEENAPANAEAPAQVPSVNILSKDAVAALDEISALTHLPASTNAMVAPVMSHLAAGDLDGAVAAVVRSCGMEPSRAAEIVSGMAEDIRGRVAAHLTARHGIDGADAVAFLDTLPAGLRMSLAHRAFLGDRTVYSEIEAKYRHAKRIAETVATPGWNAPR